MQRKQQVGECWVCVIFFACVCVWVRQIRRLRLTIPSPRALPCAPGAFLGGSQGGQVCPPLGYVERSGQRPEYAQRSAPGGSPVPRGSGQRPEIFFWAVFAIFSGFCYF
jgi:hypothetical protein